MPRSAALFARGTRFSAAALALGLLAGCSEPAPDPITAFPAPPPSVPPAPETTAPEMLGSVAPTGGYSDLATGLHVPWSIVPLDDDRALISFRDSGDIVLASRGGSVTTIGTVEGVVAQGEGGLLGLALLKGAGQTNDPGQANETGQDWLYAYYTGESDNRVVRYRLDTASGTLALGERQPVIEGFPKAGNHNGGRIAFGPDGTLYVTAGDAGDGAAAQDASALAGKILRLTPDGGIPDDNPFPGSPVYTLGHRNPQGIAWTADGRMWASEFGQNTWDELNLIEPGQNYGWPAVEGQAGEQGFVDPVHQWTTSEASPSGLTVIGDTLFMAALRGEALWVIDGAADVPDGGQRATVTATPYFTGELGRIRDVVPGPDGTLWLVTNNTDSRGSPASGDDRLVEVPLG